MILKFWREILILVLIVTLAISTRSCSNQRDEANLLKESRDSAFHEATVHKLKNGLLAFQVKTHEATIAELKRNALVLGFNKSQLEAQTGDLKRLVSYWQGRASQAGTSASVAHDTVILYINKGDTVRQAEKAFSWSNHFLSLHEVYNPKTDSLRRTYTYTTAFSLTAYRKGKTLFSPGQLVTDVTFSDPNMTVGKFEGIVIKEKPRNPWIDRVLGAVAGFFIGRHVH